MNEFRWIFMALHRGAFCQCSFRWIYYYGSNKSTRKETGKSHLCALWWRGDLGKGYDTIKGDKEHKYLLYTYCWATRVTNVVACCCTCTLNVHPATKLHSVIDILEQFFFRFFCIIFCSKNSRRIFPFSDRLILVNIVVSVLICFLWKNEKDLSSLI